MEADVDETLHNREISPEVFTLSFASTQAGISMSRAKTLACISSGVNPSSNSVFRGAIGSNL